MITIDVRIKWYSRSFVRRPDLVKIFMSEFIVSPLCRPHRPDGSRPPRANVCLRRDAALKGEAIGEHNRETPWPKVAFVLTLMSSRT